MNHKLRCTWVATLMFHLADEINAAREFSTDPSADIPPTIASKSHTNTSPVDIARANSLSSYNRPSVMQTIPSSLPDHFDFNNFDLSAPQPPMPMVCTILGPLGLPVAYSFFLLHRIHTSSTATMVVAVVTTSALSRDLVHSPPRTPKR